MNKNIEKKLGKIKSASFGFGGYQDAMLGLSLHFSFDKDSTGVMAFSSGGWAIERSEHAKWTEEDRANQQAKMCNQLIKILYMAKVQNVDQLVNKPIEATFEGNTLIDWRILEEVL